MSGTIGVADHDAAGFRTGKVHRPRSGRTPTATRNRSQYRTACGARIYYGLPVPTDTPHASLCGRCYPKDA